MHQFLSLFLVLMIVDRLTAITCPIYEGSGWYTKECPQSSYCQFNQAVASNSNGKSSIYQDVSCGIPGSPAYKAEPTVNAHSFPRDLVNIFVVSSRSFCGYPHGRWCRMTPGPETCHHMDCVLVECRCTQDNCHAFMEQGGFDQLRRGGEPDSLLSRISQSNGGFSEEWRNGDGGMECNGGFTIGKVTLMQALLYTLIKFMI